MKPLKLTQPLDQTGREALENELMEILEQSREQGSINKYKAAKSIINKLVSTEDEESFVGHA